MSEENYAFPDRYAASGGYFLPAFSDNRTVPSSRVKNPRKVFGFSTLEIRTDRLSRNVGKNTTRCVTTQKSAVLMYLAEEA